MGGLRRGATWTIPFTLLDRETGDPITVATNLTTFVWKLGGSRASTTNSATHIAGGFWTIVLTGTETDAEVVALHIVDTEGIPQVITLVPDRMDDVELAVNTATNGGSFTLKVQTNKPNEPLSASDDFWNGAILVFNSGSLKGQARMISDYTGSTKTVTFSGSGTDADAPFPSTPSANDRVTIIGRIAQ